MTDDDDTYEQEICDMEYENHDKEYSRLMLENEDERWMTYAGRTLMVGIQEGLTPQQILEYIFETYHGMTIDSGEVPLTVEDITTDIRLYFEDK